MRIRCIPGLPVKRTSPCVDPSQRKISHIVPVTVLNSEGTEIVEERWEPNWDDYPEYGWLIENYIKNNKVFKFLKRYGYTTVSFSTGYDYTELANENK